MWKDLGPHGAEKEFLAVIYGFWRRSKTPVEIPSRTVTEITGLSRTSVIMAKRALLKKEIVAAQEIRGKPSRYEEFLRAKYLFLDELGAEPERCQSYGTDYTPVQNLISYRYDRKLPFLSEVMSGTLRMCFGEKPSRNTMLVVPMSNNSASRLSNSRRGTPARKLASVAEFIHHLV